MGCRRVAEPPELVRVVRSADGSLHVGRTLPGRGAWLCKGSVACLDAATKRQAFARSFRAPVGTDAVAGLRDELIGGPTPAN